MNLFFRLGHVVWRPTGGSLEADDRESFARGASPDSLSTATPLSATTGKQLFPHFVCLFLYQIKNSLHTLKLL